MASKTPKLQLTLPSYEDAADIGVINQNFQILDEKADQWNTSAYPSTATRSEDGVVTITSPTTASAVTFYAPSDFHSEDTYRWNNTPLALTDLNYRSVRKGWKKGAPVTLQVKGEQAFYQSREPWAIEQITQKEYDSLPQKDPETIYLIVG